MRISIKPVDDMKILDNITNTVRDDLRVEIKKGSRVSIAAACFSMYAYKELKKQLETIDEFEFIFTSPTFVKEKAEKQKREFYIPRISRETSLYGTEFEIKLRNEMTQRAIAKECADWIRRKATFKSNTTGENMAGFMTVDSGAAQTAYMPIGGFTTVDIGCERGNNSYNMVNCMEAPFAQQYMKLFDTLWNDRDKMQDVTDVVLENISTAYAENSPEFIYFMTLYHVFSEFLDDISEDELPNEATGFKQSKIWSLLYDFQKDAVLAIINKLEKYNGCILADSVGLGKTFTALAVVKYYENRNKSVLVLCPKKLAENWNTYKDNYVNNPIASDRLNYDVLFHTDLSRSGGKSNGLDLDRLNWGNYDLVVIDESHNFRNGIGTHSKTQDNRYQRLMDKVIRAGVKTKVLMIYDEILMFCLLFKSPSFSFEHEYRMGIPFEDQYLGENCSKEFLLSGTTIRPQLELKNFPIRDIIEEITISPFVTSELTKIGIQELLISKGISPDVVRLSQISIR